MSAEIDLINPNQPKRVLMLASNPAISPTTGSPVGFWWAELVHPYWEFTERGYEVDVASPDGCELEGDEWSDPRHESGYSADDVLSLGFITSPPHSRLVEDSKVLEDLNLADYDVLFLVGGQGPMVTFYGDERVHRAVAEQLDGGRVAVVVCHATCVLLKATGSDAKLLVEGRTWTGFANSEEAYADDFVGQRIQPFHIETEAKKLAETNFVVQGRFKRHAVRDGNLITGQQQYSGAVAARLAIEALGV
jgi:putative intracellular protease/amidase